MTSAGKREALIIGALLVAICSWHLLTIRDGHDWGGDFSMYMAHAKNITEGRDYADTGYIFNPGYPTTPRAYPPVFPLTLAPAYMLFGLDTGAMKAEVALFLVASVALFFYAFRESMSTASMALALAAFGLSPLLRDFADSVLSDIPFLFFTLLALVLLEKSLTTGGSVKKRLLLALATGTAAYLAYGTRSVGVVLLPTVLLTDYLRNGRLTVVSALSSATFIFFAALQSLLIETGGYSELFTYGADSVPTAFYLALKYIKKFSYLWKNGYTKAVTSAVAIAFLLFAASGYIGRIKERVRGYEIFVPLYFAAITVYSAITPTGANIRYLIPLIPLYIFYALGGIERSSFLRSRGAVGKALAAAAVVIVLSYAGEYSKKEFGPLTHGVAVPESAALFNFVRDGTTEESVFIFRKPRVLALYTGRSAAFYHRPGDDGELWSYMEKIGASHIIVSKPLDDEYLPGFVERNNTYLVDVYSNRDFTVYAVKGA